MKQVITSYINSKKILMESFECKNNYHVEPIVECKWKVKKEDDIYIFSYWKTDEDKKDLIVVKKNGEPIILNNDKYTMIVGINCIKIAYIVKNKNKIL